jgi:tRNA-specific 2-thiouridylase
MTGLCRTIEGGLPKRIVVAMSGGVDSSVAAALLHERGCEVIGVTLRLRDCEEGRPSRSCCGDDGPVRAREVCGILGIRHYVLDCVSEFERLVLRPSWEKYSEGLTPNPCLLCNEHIKFGVVLSWSAGVGASGVATGHYAGIERDEAGRPVLVRGMDRSKDQSYFLSGLTAKQLGSVFFPLGSMTKPEVRGVAAALSLPCADARESQDACLLQEGRSFAEMLRLRFNGRPRPGDIVNDEGLVMGQHDGIHLFTVGQRHGIPVHSIKRLWVKKIECGPDRVVVTDCERGLESGGLIAGGLAWIRDAPPAGDLTCSVQVRYRHAPVECLVTNLAGDRARVVFSRPVRAVTPGQAVVFYDGVRVLGRGWIDEASQ